MNRLVLTAIANATLGGGVIFALLLALMRDANRLDAQIDRVEQKLTEDGVEELEQLG